MHLVTDGFGHVYSYRQLSLGMDWILLCSKQACLREKMSLLHSKTGGKNNKPYIKTTRYGRTIIRFLPILV